jgi:two-component system, NtrC family, sensor histidine kinase HydH
MSLRTYPFRFLVFTVLSSLLVGTLCGGLAVYLNHQQAQTAGVLEENIGSRRAAANLEETLTALIALHRKGTKHVEPLQERAEEHLQEIERYVDKDRERELARQISDSYQSYYEAWKADPRHPDEDSIRQLNDVTLPACRELQKFNARQVEESESEHRRSLQQMSAGLAVIGVMGAVSGLVLGYGLARGLRQTIHQLLIRVQVASDRLGQELPPVEWQRDGKREEDGTQELVHQVEQVVQKLQQKETEIRRAERLAALGQLAAGIAHEIRNPLTSIKLLVQTTRNDPEAGGLNDDDLRLIEEEIRRMERSLQTFLDYARPPQIQRVACDLSAIIQDGLSLLRGRAEQQGVTMHFEPPIQPVVIEADGEQLRQVVVNLALNALDAMPHGGSLDVELRPRESNAIELSVTDTGQGIAGEILPRLFEPFATGKKTGLGLGLVVVRRIVEDHGGIVRGSNLPGGGARFVMTLPVKKQQTLEYVHADPAHRR